MLTFQAQTKAGGMFLSGDQEMVKTVVPLTRTEVITKEGLESKLATIRVSGATPTGEAIEGGLKELYGGDEGEVRRIKKMVVITDEKSNVGQRPEKVVNDEVARRAIIDIIAVGGKVSRGAYEKIASKTGGRFWVAVEPDDLVQAMKPRVEMKGLGVDQGLLDDVAKAASRLESSRKAGESSFEYRQALEWARLLRAKANKRLMEVLMLKSRSEAEVKTLAAQAGKELPMGEYAKRVWPRASELEQVGKVEKELRDATEKLAA